MSATLYPHAVTASEVEMLELIRGVAEQQFVCTIELHPENGWLIRFADGETGKERQVSGSTFDEAWTALRHGPRGFFAIAGGKH